MPIDKDNGGARAGDVSPWSEYRRLVLAELERINVQLDKMRGECETMRRDIALMNDRLDQAARDRNQMRDRIDSVTSRTGGDQIPGPLRSRIDELEKEYRSARDRIGGISIAFGAVITVITIAATVWNAWIK